ncbi:hypothetical protein HDV00_012059 [Rhizophlyctis rosea]|nr:hypothetical protein HDV00_012059 [Rhizophlyctis rosea]
MKKFLNFGKALPVQTGITSHVDTITDKTAPEFNESLATIVTSIILENPTAGSKECLKAIKKRLKHENPIVQNYTLLLLDHCIRTCGARFRVELMEQDDILKNWVASREAYQDNIQFLVSMTQAWKLLDPGMALFVEGLEGEFAQLGYMANVAPRTTSLGAAGQPNRPQQNVVTFEERKRAIEADIVTAKNNITMFMDILANLDPQEDVAANQLVQEFRGQCIRINERVVALINDIDDPDLLGRLIKVKEEVDDVLQHYWEVIDQRRLDSDVSKTIQASRPPSAQGPTNAFNDLQGLDFSSSGGHTHDPFADENGAGPSRPPSVEPYYIPSEKALG